MSLNFPVEGSKMQKNKGFKLNENVLQFTDIESYEAFILNLELGDIDLMLKKLDDLNFVSQYKLLKIADAELNNIIEAATTKEEFTTSYDAYKNKYKHIFMFNNLDSEDLSAHSRFVTTSNEYLTNQEGVFLIGDSIVRPKQFISYDEKINLISTRDCSTVDTGLNHAWSNQSTRKVHLYVSFDHVGQILGQFTAQKKTWLGWVRYDTEYYSEMRIFPAMGVYDSFYSNLSSDNGELVEIRTGELPGNHTFAIGIIRNFQQNLSCTGDMSIHSRGVTAKGYARIKL